MTRAPRAMPWTLAARLAPAALLAALVCTPALSQTPATPSALTTWLIQRDHAALERSLSAVQQGFEAGTVTETDLRQAFAPFGALNDERALQSLRDWAAQAPDSYAAQLAFGLSHRVQGSEARGRRYWEDTPPERHEGMQQAFALAEPALRRSVALTAIPYLSLVNLMSIAANLGDRGTLHASLLLANQALPGNRSVRLQYARFLLPRWGGSHAQLEAFIAQSREQGVAPGTLLEMQAIALNDIAQQRRAEGDEPGARERFRQSLQLARQAGDVRGFRASYLSAAVRYLCQDGDAERRDPLCRNAQGAIPDARAVRSDGAGRAGDDIAHAVVMPPMNRFEAVLTEKAWLALRHPGATVTARTRLTQNDRLIDAISITVPDVRATTLFFDVTAVGVGSGGAP